MNDAIHWCTKCLTTTFINILGNSTCTIECPVCMEKITKDTGMKMASCGHPLCYKCFEEVKNINNKCPICRKIYM